MRYVLLGLLLVVSLSRQHHALAQEQERVTDEQLWGDLYGHYYISDKLEFYGDVGLRLLLEDPSWTQFYIRPSVRYHYRPILEFHGGLGLALTNNADVQSDKLEIRPFQGVKVGWPTLGGLRLVHYVRLEERLFFFTDEAWAHDFQLRFRYRLSTKIPLRRLSQERKWFIALSGEGFGEVGPDVEERFSNRTRFSVGLGHAVNETWAVGFHVVLQQSRTGKDAVFETTDYLFQLKLRRFVARRDYRDARRGLEEQ